MTADDVVALLELTPHPEGGHFRETVRDAPPEGGRAHSTAIYYLLAAGEESHWHRVVQGEVWHWYAGAALSLKMVAPDGRRQTVRLGSALAEGYRPQALVPPGHWQSARSLGDWTLVGCTVAPGFEFSDFEMAPPGWSPPETQDTQGKRK